MMSGLRTQLRATPAKRVRPSLVIQPVDSAGSVSSGPSLTPRTIAHRAPTASHRRANSCDSQSTKLAPNCACSSRFAPGEPTGLSTPTTVTPAPLSAIGGFHRSPVSRSTTSPTTGARSVCVNPPATPNKTTNEYACGSIVPIARVTLPSPGPMRRTSHVAPTRRAAARRSISSGHRTRIRLVIEPIVPALRRLSPGSASILLS